jgi:hypothetical protein
MRCVLGCIVGVALLFPANFAVAQNTLDALVQELNEAQQKHTEVTDKILSTFFTQVDAAMASPDAAVTLYQQARITPSDPPLVLSEHDSESAILNSLLRCGIPPTPVVSEHDSESASEKEARVALDVANLSRLGYALQLHSGLLHFAALFALKPDQPGLQSAWVEWLKSAVPISLQLAPPFDRTPPPPPDLVQAAAHDDQEDQHELHRPPPFIPNEMKGKTVRDSVITKYLGFTGFNDKDQGSWSVRDIPRFYRANILDPLRTKPTPATLAAWDDVIAMANADEPDTDNWNNIINPSLQFDRACDAYLLAPSTESLETLVNFIRTYPTYPKAGDWIKRVHQLIDDYRARRGGAAAATENSTAPTPVSNRNPNVSVTTVQQGDMTIVTTHTNSAPVMNAPPMP